MECKSEFSAVQWLKQQLTLIIYSANKFRSVALNLMKNAIVTNHTFIPV